MKLSTKGRYGTLLMIDLALNAGQGPVFLKDIAARQKISEKYLWHLIAPLKHAGLINSIRGAHGGYILARPPADITLKEIVSIVEGPISLVERKDIHSAHERDVKNVTQKIWNEISEKIAGIFAGYTLQDVVDRYKAQSKIPMYSI
ncbi:MAG: RrF2 family transcriptional regulator [Candidatus Omnitrophota bacterium]